MDEPELGGTGCHARNTCDDTEGMCQEGELTDLWQELCYRGENGQMTVCSGGAVESIERVGGREEGQGKVDGCWVDWMVILENVSQ